MKKYSRLAVDTMIIIYLIEGNRVYSESIKKILKNADEIIFSSFGLGEALVGFEKSENLKEKLKFFSFIESFERLKVVGFGKQEALFFARLRAKYFSLKAPDAIHLATALSSEADAFLTNDRKLPGIKEINVFTLK